MLSFCDTPERMRKRKNDHIDLCQTKDVESLGSPFAHVQLIPEALPEMDFTEINTSQTFLGKTFSLPFLITGMTGGVEKGRHINHLLGRAAQEFGIPMGLGSQKLMINEAGHKDLFDIKSTAPQAFVMGNIGAVSLNYEVTITQILKLVEELKLDAFCIHLNALQECIQPEGERNFANLLKKIKELTRQLDTLHIPVMVKEVGSGISLTTFEKLMACGVAAVDVGGCGGTSWSAIEGMRANSLGKRLGELFRNWGYTTSTSLRQCATSSQRRNTDLVATGGMRDGLQAAKALACGATMVGIGLPLLRAALSSEQPEEAYEALRQELMFFQESLRIAMFCTGSRTVAHLKNALGDTGNFG